MADPKTIIWGTGRRKTSVARVRLMPGNGAIVVNEREVDRYFLSHDSRDAVRRPLATCEVAAKYDVAVKVHGGGMESQAGAVRHGLSRALAKADPTLEARLRAAGFLTRDSRRKERKKYGQRGARARFQFSKR